LALLPGNLSPRLQEALVRLSTQQPSFAKVAAELTFFTGATVRILDRPHAAEHITLIGQTTAPSSPLLSAAECARLRRERQTRWA
jgi:hypothetical protein